MKIGAKWIILISAILFSNAIFAKELTQQVPFTNEKLMTGASIEKHQDDLISLITYQEYIPEGPQPIPEDVK